MGGTYDDPVAFRQSILDRLRSEARARGQAASIASPTAAGPRDRHPMSQGPAPRCRRTCNAFHAIKGCAAMRSARS